MRDGLPVAPADWLNKHEAACFYIFALVILGLAAWSVIDGSPLLAASELIYALGMTIYPSMLKCREQIGWMRGRREMRTSMMEAQMRGLSLDDWRHGEWERDEAVAEQMLRARPWRITR